MSGKTEILDLNRFDPRKSADMPVELAERLDKRAATFGASSVLFYEQPIEMVSAQGCYMVDRQGRRYLDVYNNVPSVGHCHPRVVEAIAKQAAVLNIHTRYLNRVVEAYAERLLSTFPTPLSNLVMTCTGSESNDLALRIARCVTGAEGFIVTETAYHGNTALVTEISPSALKRRKPAGFVRSVPAPSGEAPGPAFAAAVKAAMADLEAQGIKTAVLIVDSIFSSDGIYADPPGFLQDAVQAVRDAGGLFIADEVQPGFGRTGHGLWGFARHGLVPDIVTMGKPMGNGFPMGGVVTRPDFLARFCEETGYFNTFGGNPVAAAAGLAVLGVIEEEGLIENARTVGTYFIEQLRGLKAERIGEVRGAGLFIGLDFVDPASGAPDAPLATHAINEMKKAGILIGAAGKHGATLKIRPPLCFSRSDADYFLDTVSKVLAH
ncbi:aspartate aminotransferase family protein [Acetobacteraceae bacterium H6797]|nr:aspartate aminotransferase family protein [Acetobacteraceae bacterium H6797]